MKRYPVILIILTILTQTRLTSASAPGVTADSVCIPLGGNAFVVPALDNTSENINSNGLINWVSEASMVRIYFKVEKQGVFNLALKAKSNSESKIKATILKESFEKTLTNKDYEVLQLGKVEVAESGYIHLDLRGLSKRGSAFGEVSDLIVYGTPELLDGISFVKNDKDAGYYFGRRGPSVHLKYHIPEGVQDRIEWFYNEIIVPKGNDVIGSYYMANGFSGGYFGIQANSAHERRVLFSIWSPFNTDDPKSIPDSLKIKLLKKGKEVHAGEFGNEGSGGQSYTIYPWKVATRYSFLTRVQPTGRNTAIFTSYFKETSADNWMLIASFERPQTNSYLKNPHSFLENFNPSTGYKERRVLFQNQWARDTEGTWFEIKEAKFTGDNTARLNFRKDYGGGMSGAAFYLRNCGFFNDNTPLDSTFKRTSATGSHPYIDFSKLP